MPQETQKLLPCMKNVFFNCYFFHVWNLFYLRYDLSLDGKKGVVIKHQLSQHISVSLFTVEPYIWLKKHFVNTAPWLDAAAKTTMSDHESFSSSSSPLRIWHIPLNDREQANMCFWSPSVCTFHMIVIDNMHPHYTGKQRDANKLKKNRIVHINSKKKQRNESHCYVNVTFNAKVSEILIWCHCMCVKEDTVPPSHHHWCIHI